ncbi:lipocalin family protein [Hwangdonia lutea]|uniref:Lipocalin family protein n=1 Tax=Hwangdonia lutea TaxID=3075823 RepID=A0AA97HS80_9FLAO|nr:lipocalin family protein [Hwangdonia sp. SCSIO 19198]WOD44820.1 lipocalin family protein [Hwangdonia sp. SCSIO 19198]
MKHLLILLLTVTFVSCGSTKTVRQAKKTIKGNWTLTSVTYNKTGTYNVTLLNDASKACFEGSTWQFVPNNNTGTYAINQTACNTGERYFNFTIQEVDAQTGLYDFLLKPTNEKGKSETNQGFRIKLKALSETSMQWEQTVLVDGAPFVITMNFTLQ